MEDKVVEIVGGGSDIKGVIPSSFMTGSRYSGPMGKGLGWPPHYVLA